MFILIAMILILPCLFTDKEEKKIKKEIKDWKRVIGE